MKFSVPANDLPLVSSEPPECRQCGSTSRLKNGLCLNCLLRGAMEDDNAASCKRTFKDVLVAVDIQNAAWRIGDYEIVSEIGRGGMGVVYRAREPHSGRVVALKCVLNYHVDSDQTLARFRREAEMATRLDHPNIVPVYYVGESADGLPFFTMKFAGGGSLAKTRGLLPHEPRRSVLLMTKVARAVQYAHDEGVLHRDLKPANLLLDDRSEPLVSDFGLAKWQTSSHLTRSLTIFGTPGYVAPEQAEGPAARLTAAADIYSLGAILFELLSGRPPFLGEHALAVIRQASENVAPGLRSLAPHLDRDLETICARCLEREPSARYHKADDLAHDLQSWLDGRVIKARPVGFAGRGRRWLRRNRMLGAAITACAALAATTLLWQVRSSKLQSAVRESTLAARSVLIAPFLDLDSLTSDPALAQSLAASLQTQLDELGPARVKTAEPSSSIDWNRAEDVQKAGRAAGARTVLMGTERSFHGKKRVSFRLLDTATGQLLFMHLWEGAGSDNLGKAGAQTIGQSIDAILSAHDWSGIIESKVDPGLRDDDAKNAIIAGRELMSRYNAADLDHAIALFQQAIRAEPRSSLAHSCLAFAAIGRTHFIADFSFLELGKAEIRKALELSPDSSDAHNALAAAYYQDGKFSEALEEEMRTLEAAGPERKLVRFIGQTLDTSGRPSQALRWYMLASKLEGIRGEVDALIGDCWVKLCHDARALQAYSRMTELQPNCPQGGVGICHVRLLQGDFAGARELYRNGRWNRSDLGDTQRIAAQTEFFARDFYAAEKLYADLANADPDGGGSFYGAITYRSALGRAREALGDAEGAKAVLSECLVREKAAVQHAPANPEAAYRLAAVEASLGLSESSLKHLAAAAALGWIDYRSLARDPRFDQVRQSAEFNRILKDLSTKVANLRAEITY